MQPVAIVTLIGVAATILVLAVYLVAVAWILHRVSFTLGTVIAGLRAIANQTQPLQPVVDEINEDLAGVQKALEDLLAKKTSKVS
jgi:uncharacterized protein YoxC